MFVFQLDKQAFKRCPVRANAHKRGLIAVFWISKKLSTLYCARLMQWLEALGVLVHMKWVIYALIES